jgi:FkbM family methyltransferase
VAEVPANDDRRSREELYRVLSDHYFGPNQDEAREVEALPGLLRGAQVFVDVGASLGQYTCCAQETLHDAQIFAIEADPVRFERLAELCADWARSPRNNRIVPMHRAVADTNGAVTFFVTDADRSGGLFPYDSDPESRYAWREVTVPAATLDSLFHGDLIPDLVKMDIEGGEYRALLGASEILRSGKTRFMVEIHPWGDPTIGKRESDVFDLFAEAGYDFRRLHHHWLFTKTNSAIRRRLKNRAIHLILDHRSIRTTVRRLFRGKR